MQDYELLELEHLVLGRRGCRRVAPIAGRQCPTFGARTWPIDLDSESSLKGSLNSMLPSDADLDAGDIGALGEMMCKTLSISTYADDDAASYAYESDGEEDMEEMDWEQHPQPKAMSVIPSVGSAFHATGACKPCAWFWKPGGCRNARECRHCHLCPEGEVRARKRTKNSTPADGEQAKQPEEPLDVVPRSTPSAPIRLMPLPPGLSPVQSPRCSTASPVELSPFPPPPRALAAAGGGGGHVHAAGADGNARGARGTSCERPRQRLCRLLDAWNGPLPALHVVLEAAGLQQWCGLLALPPLPGWRQPGAQADVKEALEAAAQGAAREHSGGLAGVRSASTPSRGGRSCH